VNGARYYGGSVVHLLYCDETNLEERKGDFFAYAGVVVEGARARDLSHVIDGIRTAAKVPANYRLKFNPGPECLDHQQFIELKKAVIAAAIDAKVGLLVSVILHDIAKSPEIARLNAINTLCFHFDCLLGRIPGPGLVLIDRFIVLCRSASCGTIRHKSGVNARARVRARAWAKGIRIWRVR
jgi:hypothetical protein